MRVHVDITDLVEYLCTADVLHGVQNVTHRLVLELRERPASQLIGFHPIYGRPFAVAPARLAAASLADIPGLKALLGIDGRRPVKSTSAIRNRHSGRPLRRLFEHAKRGWRQGLRSRQPPAPPVALHRDVKGFAIAAGDLVIVPGLNVWYPEYTGRLGAEVRAQAGRLVVVVHDLGPVTAAAYFPASYRAAFGDWMQSLFPFADLFVADSEHTRTELSTIDPALRGRAACVVNPLAHEFPRALPATLPQQAWEPAEGSYVLHVGRIEPRKNIAGLVAAWGRLAADLGPALPALVLAGRMNDPTGAFAKAVGGLGAAAACIRFIENPSTAELALLYAGCRFAVYPSFYEGWGLPVGEAACFGKVTAASRAASIPEVVGDLAVYFDPHDLDDMAAVLRRLICERDHLAGLEARLVAQFHPRSWADCSKRLLDLAAQASAGPPR